jgi:hypothetical protein
MSSRHCAGSCLLVILLLFVAACTETAPGADFVDTFDQGMKENWRPYKNNNISGDWIVDKGRARVSGLALSHQDQVCGMMVLGDEAWKQYAMEMDVAVAPIARGGLFVWLGIGSEGPAPDSYNYIGLKHDGRQYLADYAAVSNSQKALESAPRHIRIEVRDKRLVLQANRATVYDYRLPQSLAGAVGLMSCTPIGTPAQVTSIDNFALYQLTP